MLKKQILARLFFYFFNNRAKYTTLEEYLFPVSTTEIQ